MNNVFLNDQNMIEIRVRGPQTPESVMAMADKIREFIVTLRTEQRPVLILDDISEMSLKQPSSVPKTVAAQARSLDYDRIVMLGSGNRMLRYSTNFIIQALGQSQKIKYFSDREKAMAWLQGRPK